MGMSYSVRFHNAHITPERYAEQIGATPEEVRANPRKYQEDAMAWADEFFTDKCSDFAVDNGDLILDHCGFYEGASYSYGEELMSLLKLCEPGAYTHEIDVENSTGNQWRHVVQADRSIELIQPRVVWPGTEFIVGAADDNGVLVINTEGLVRRIRQEEADPEHRFTAYRLAAAYFGNPTVGQEQNA